MRNFFILFSFLCFCLRYISAQTNGGPDLYGYIWKDSNDSASDHPVYTWKDIRGIGTNVTSGLTDDNAIGPYNLGWSFHYYNMDINKVKIGSNGWVSFKTMVGNIAHCFPSIPSAGGTADNYFAPLMSDFVFNNNPGNVGKVYYWSNHADTFIISYDSISWWRPSGPGFAGSCSFQAVLSGVDSSITFHYQFIDSTNYYWTQVCASNTVIGIENLTGNTGLQYAANQIPDNLYAVKFFFPLNPPIGILEDLHSNNLQLKVFPNPANEEITIELHSHVPGAGTLQFITIYGQVIRNDRLELIAGKQNLFNFNTGNLPSGIYYLRFETGTIVETRKILIIH